MAGLPMGPYWGLRRLADDSGRFMLLDLRSAPRSVLDDLVRGLAPFATGVVLAGGAQREVWRLLGSPHVGRVESVAHAGELDAARTTAADAVLADAALDPAPRALGLARLGDDEHADLGIDRATGLSVRTTDGATAIDVGAAGYLTTPAFVAAAIATSDAAARRLLIADELVPRLQALNAQVADLDCGTWLDA